MGEILFYAGLGGMGLCMVLLLLMIPLFRKQRSRMLKRIEEGQEE